MALLEVTTQVSHPGEGSDQIGWFLVTVNLRTDGEPLYCQDCRDLRHHRHRFFTRKFLMRS